MPFTTADPIRDGCCRHRRSHGAAKIWTFQKELCPRTTRDSPDEPLDSGLLHDAGKHHGKSAELGFFREHFGHHPARTSEFQVTSATSWRVEFPRAGQSLVAKQAPIATHQLARALGPQPPTRGRRRILAARHRPLLMASALRCSVKLRVVGGPGVLCGRERPGSLGSLTTQMTLEKCAGIAGPCPSVRDSYLPSRLDPSS